jgi:hypothetical protein
MLIFITDAPRILDTTMCLTNSLGRDTGVNSIVR